MRGDAEMPGIQRPINDEVLSNITGGRYSGPVFIYVMKEGDNLSLLAQRFGTTVRTLQELNGIQSQDQVHAGLSLRVPQR